MISVEEQIQSSVEYAFLRKSGFGLARVKTEGEPIVYDNDSAMARGYQIVGEDEWNEYANG